MAKFWQVVLDSLGMGSSHEEKLDQAAQKMGQEVGLHRDLAAKSVALARSSQRELAEAVLRYRNLEEAAIQLQRQGRAEAVGYLAVELAETKAKVETLTAQTEQSTSSASEAVERFRQERDETVVLLRKHGQLKAVAEMNSQLDKLRAEMKAISGATTARGAYEAIANQIEIKAQEHRALAELESGDTTRKAEVAQALRGIETQQILEGIKARAALEGSEPIVKIEVLDRAETALNRDPIKGFLALPSAPSEAPEAETPNGPGEDQGEKK
jgi:phage shock protein A